MPLFWLNYRHPNGRFAGATVIEASTLISARMAATVYGLNDGLKFASGDELDAESARQVPESMIGRLLDDGDLRRLQRMLLIKKPPAPSVRLSDGQKESKAMTLVLRKQRAQDRIEGREPFDWSEDDYTVVDETRIGRIYREQVPAGLKWRWFLQTVPAPPPNQGMADTLDEATAALAKRYEQVKRGE